MPSETVRLSRVRALLDSGAARTIREAHGLSLAELAADVGVTAAALVRWELRQRRPRRAAALRYLEVLEQLTGVAS